MTLDELGLEPWEQNPTMWLLRDFTVGRRLVRVAWKISDNRYYINGDYGGVTGNNMHYSNLEPIVAQCILNEVFKEQ